MKLLILFCLFLSGCSLIKINEAPQVPKVRPEFLGVTELVPGHELQTRIRVSDIIEYFDEEGQSCKIIIRGEDPVQTNSPCNDVDGMIRK